jgi:hypothetical protein
MRKKSTVPARRSNHKGKRGDAAPVRPRLKSKRALDPFFADKELFHDAGPSDLAEDHDKYLSAILAAEHERGQRR